MSIIQAAYKSLLREYDEKQLRARYEARSRKERIEDEIPRLKEIEGELAGVYVKKAGSRISGSGADFEEEIKRLRDEKDALLKENGYSAADLEIRYECPVCSDTGFTENGPCGCFKARLTDILYDRSNIRQVLEKENFGTFSLEYYSEKPISEKLKKSEREMAKAAYETAKAFISDFDRTDTNLYIYGECGTGKTFLSNCIAKEVIESGRFVIYLSAVRFFDLLSEAAFDKTGSLKEISDYIYECDLLIIDDLGTEVSSDFKNKILFTCINERLIAGRHTIISGNLTIQKLKEKYSERIFSRIAYRYTMIKLYGSDIRRKKRLEN